MNGDWFPEDFGMMGRKQSRVSKGVFAREPDTGSRTGCRADEGNARQGSNLTGYNIDSGPGSGHSESTESHINSTGQ